MSALSPLPVFPCSLQPMFVVLICTPASEPQDESIPWHNFWNSCDKQSFSSLSEYNTLPKTCLLLADDKWCPFLSAVISGHVLLQGFINEQRLSGVKFALSWNTSWLISAAICAPALSVLFCLCTLFSPLPTERIESGLIIIFADWEVSFTSKKSNPMLAQAPKASRAVEPIQRGWI